MHNFIEVLMKIIDLSHTIVDDLPVYPGDVPVSLKHKRTLEIDTYNAFMFKSSQHVGTHVDMPMHMLSDERTADKFVIDSFIGNGVLLDVRGENEIKYKQEYNRLISSGDIVLLYTGYSDCFEHECYFTDHPVVLQSLAEFFIERRIKMIGMDLPSPDKRPFNIHKILMLRGIFIMENNTNLAALKDYPSFEVEAVPLKIQAEASLVRAFARVEK